MAARARVSWFEPATLVTPDLWYTIGSMNVASVLVGSVLTVLDRIA